MTQISKQNLQHVYQNNYVYLNLNGSVTTIVDFDKSVLYH